MPGPKTIAEPEKELRFTRARQGFFFAALASICLGTIILLIVAFTQNRELLTTYLWLLVPLLAAAGAIWLFLRCTRHAYLILSPLGIEIFPFFKPAKGLQVIYWSQIDHAEVDDGHSHLTIHFNKEQTAGIIASLSPISKARRALLKTAIEGTMANRAKETETPH